MRPVIGADEAARRLGHIFPRASFDSVLSNPLAGWAVAALVYVDAVAAIGDDPPVWARPSTVIWQQADIHAAHATDQEREDWRRAAATGQKATRDLLRSWGIPMNPRYRDNSRETLRDEIFRLWNEYGAMRKRPGLPTASSLPRWALEAHFAALFEPSLEGDELVDAITEWTERHMQAGARLRALRAHATAQATHTVSVTLPNGRTRMLEPGKSSLIMKGVVEEWAVRKLIDPVVLTISEPGAKSLVSDETTLASLGVAIDVSNLLPDAVIADVGVDPVQFWVVEAVATDGPVTEARKSELLRWASKQRIQPDSLRFLTAFESRGDGPARRRLKDLASGTFAWFADEPDHELSWDDIASENDGDLNPPTHHPCQDVSGTKKGCQWVRSQQSKRMRFGISGEQETHPG